MGALPLFAAPQKPLAPAWGVLTLASMTRFRKVFLAGLLLGTATTRAQISLQVELDQEQYIPREPITAAVRIVNRSGITLHMGRSPDWLSFDVEATDNEFVPRLGEAPVVHPFELPNGARGTRRVNIAPYFDLREVGRYKLIVTVRIPELQQELTAPPAYFNLISGATIWEQPFGWRPVIDGQPRELQFRRYALVSAMNGKKVVLFARLADRDNLNILRVYRLGRVLTFSRPQARIDNRSNLHVLWQTSAKVFTYVKLGPQLNLILHQTHQYTSSRPGLRTLPDGQIKVVGGARISNPADFPPPRRAGGSAAGPSLDGRSPSGQAPVPDAAPPLDAEPGALHPATPAPQAPKAPPARPERP